MVSVLMMNVRGLQDDMKCKETFFYINKMKFDVTFLQEMHSTLQNEKEWKNNWKGEIVYDHFQSNG